MKPEPYTCTYWGGTEEEVIPFAASQIDSEHANAPSPISLIYHPFSGHRLRVQATPKR